MKKVLLLTTAAVMAAGSLFAQEAKVYPGEAFTGFSPDGKYAVSEAYDRVAILDLNADKTYEYYEEGYYLGNGNNISNTGIVVGSTFNSTACYWKDGDWNIINVGNRNMSKADGITPTGTRIVGSVAPENYEGDFEGLMLIPCYWDVNADGTLSDFHMLPYPTKDFSGRTPQYITAIRVSDDGKTIAGQIQDYSGSVCQPIVYKQNGDGEWSYTLIHNELFYPEGFELPEYPGDDAPEFKDFMTEEEFAAYNKALDDWNANGEFDYSTYPNYWDYMTEAEFAAYEAASNEWNEKYWAFSDAFYQLVSSIPVFSFNNVLLSRDGKTYATTHTFEDFDFMTWTSIYEYTPYVFNLENDTYKTYPNSDVNLILSSLTDDGTLLAQSSDPLLGFRSAYILPAGAENFETLYDYFVSTNASLAAWMKEHMTHEYEAWDMETYETYIDEAFVSGIPFANADMSVIGTTVENFWDYESDPFYSTYSYLFNLNYTTGITVPATSNGNISVRGRKGGELLFKGEIASATVYDMNGGKTFTVDNPGESVATGLGTGVYVVKTVGADGTINITKVTL